MGVSFKVGWAWLNPWLQIVAYTLIIGLTYFIFQLSLGTIFKQPEVSRSIYSGIWVMPFSWVLAAILFSGVPLDWTAWLFVVCCLFTFVPWIVFLFASHVIYLFTGIDTCQLPQSMKFGFTIEHKDEASIELLKTVLDRTGFRVKRQILADTFPGIAGYVAAGKRALNLGLGYVRKNQVTDSVFVLYEIVNESVAEVGRKDEVLDMRGEIDGLLDSWKRRGKIKNYSSKEASQIQSTLLQGLVRVIEADLGPKTLAIPSLSEVKTKIWAYPKNHPYQFMLIIGVIEAFVLWLLGQLLPRLSGP